MGDVLNSLCFVETSNFILIRGKYNRYCIGNILLSLLSFLFLGITGERQMILVRSGNEPAYWQEEIIPVYVEKNYKIAFEAETGDSGKTYIALDDVSLTPVSSEQFKIVDD